MREVLARRWLATPLIGSLMAVGPALAQDIKLTRTVKSGVEALIGHERSWDRDCQPRPSRVTITASPANGTAWVAHGASTIPESTPRSGSSGQCAGKPITGNRVMYRSNPGFRGTDTVAYDVWYGAGQGGGSTTITVR
jgi:hypothetical protein